MLRVQKATWLTLLWLSSVAWAFVPHRSTKPSLVVLDMAKKMKSKQMDLLKKMEEAKKQAAEQEGVLTTDPANKPISKLSDQEMKAKNDRLRFEELLRTQSSSVLNNFESDGYLSKEQEEEEITAYTAGSDRLFEGDPAPVQPFEELVSIKSENAIGSNGAKRLVPWLRNTNTNDYLIVLCDPRMKSPELREAVQKLKDGLDKDILSRLIVINADTPAENRRWLKKFNMEEDVKVYSDEKMDWMRAYTALGDKRWSMTMFIIKDGRVSKLARDIKVLSADRVIMNAAKSVLEERRL